MPANPLGPMMLDLYQLTQVYTLWDQELLAKEGIFNLYYRPIAYGKEKFLGPFGGGYSVYVGLEATLRFVQNFRYTPEQLTYLSTLKGADKKPLFEKDEFFDFLAQVNMEQLSIRAMREGTVCFADETLLQARGPFYLGLLLETRALNLTGYPTLVATKAARGKLASGNSLLYEFGLRRAQDDGGLSGSRAAYIGGADATSNVAAGMVFGIPVVGTQSHALIMSYLTQIEGMRAFARSMPGNCSLLIDTYSIDAGVRDASIVGLEQKAKGQNLFAVRIDSGDLAYWSKRVRAQLDKHGLTAVKIAVSNDLDEQTIASLRSQGAPIDTFCEGTQLIIAGGSPSLGCVYKAAAWRMGPDADWVYPMKVSASIEKAPIPGDHQIYRYFRTSADYERGYGYDFDMIVNRADAPAGDTEMYDPRSVNESKRVKRGGERIDLLQPVWEGGQIVCDLPPVDEIKTYTKSELVLLDPTVRRLEMPHKYLVGLEQRLYDLRNQRIREVRERDAQELAALENESPGSAQ
jgi:nicotinate phosphoribosyltransferase